MRVITFVVCSIAGFSLVSGSATTLIVVGESLIKPFIFEV